jgi:hypothetical protein
MAYDRYETRDAPRDERSRWRGERFEGRERGGHEDRGFFERAGDEVASWFGDEDAERRRREDEMRHQRERGSGRDWGRDGRSDEARASRWTGRDFDHEHERGQWPNHERERGERGAPERLSSERERERERERGYRPIAGDYARGSEQFFAASGFGREDFERNRGSRERGASGREERPREFDPRYQAWRQRHMSELDRDYDEYRREHQARFESDFGSWRDGRMRKRALLDQIREHMEVVGSDDQHVGTIDCVAGDRIILTKSDPDSGGVHHSLSGSDIDRIEDDRVVLDLGAEQAKQHWRDESRDRALFEREDRGEMGPRNLDRSFEGTYR